MNCNGQKWAYSPTPRNPRVAYDDGDDDVVVIVITVVKALCER